MIPVQKDSVAKAIQESVAAWWEDRIDDTGKKTGEQYKMRSIVFPSMLISMSQLIIGICYEIAKSKGIEKPSVKDVLVICNMDQHNFIEYFKLFNSLSGFTKKWLDESAVFDDNECWYDFGTIIRNYQKISEETAE